MKKKIMYLAAGIFFGFSLSRVGAAEYDLIYAMFAAEDLKLAWVILTAIATGFIGMRLLLGTGGRTLDGRMITVNKKRLSKLNAVGGAIFGVGWGMSGACPALSWPRWARASCSGFSRWPVLSRGRTFTPCSSKSTSRWIYSDPGYLCNGIRF